MFNRLVACFLCVCVALAAAADQGGPGPVSEPAAVQEADLGALLNASYNAMVTLVAGDTRLVAHRAVLARSPVLAERFRREQIPGSGPLAVGDVQGAVLRQLLAHLYTLQPPRLPAMAPQLLAAADAFGVSALKAECERQVAQQLTVESAAAAAVLAVRHNAPTLRDAALSFIRKHTHEVLGTRGWMEAVRTYPEAVIRVSQLLSETSENGNAAAEEMGKKLIQAAKEGTLEDVRALLRAGADVGARDGSGATALHWAARQGHLEVAKLLLQARADPDAKTGDGKTPRDVAAEAGQQPLVELFE